jgi:hypothetical protein
MKNNQGSRRTHQELQQNGRNRTEDDFVEKSNEKILGRFSTSKEPV